MASPCAARARGVARGGRRARAAVAHRRVARARVPHASASSSHAEPSPTRSAPLAPASPAPGRLSVGRDAHVARGVAPYARDSLTKDVARGRGSGDAAKRERTAKHTFHTEGGRQVHVEVIPVGETYLAIFEVAEDVEHDLHGEPISNTCGELWLHWGMHREWLDEWMSLPEIPAGSQYVEGGEARRAPRFGQNTAATRAPLVRDGDRSTVVYRRGFPMRFARAKFEIPSYYAPLEMNFVLVEKKPPTAEFPDEEGAVVYDMPKRKHPHDPPAAFAVPVGAARGCPYPLGASRAVDSGPPPGRAGATSRCTARARRR